MLGVPFERPAHHRHLRKMCVADLVAMSVAVYATNSKGGHGPRQQGSGDETVDQTIFERVMRQFGIVLELHFFEDTCPIRINSADSHAEVFRNLFEAFTDRDQTHHLVLAVGEELVGRSLGLFIEVGDEQFRHGGAHKLSTSKDLSQGLNQFVRRAVFGEVPGRPCLQHSPGQLIFRIGAEHEDREFRADLLEIFQGIEAALPRHAHIEDDDVPGEFLDPVDHFLRVSRFADNGALELLVENLFDALPDDGMIIYHQNLCHDVLHLLRLARRENRALRRTSAPVSPAGRLLKRNPHSHSSSRFGIPGKGDAAAEQ